MHDDFTDSPAARRRPILPTDRRVSPASHDAAVAGRASAPAARYGWWAPARAIPICSP